jgi:hypothetical protein
VSARPATLSALAAALLAPAACAPPPVRAPVSAIEVTVSPQEASPPGAPPPGAPPPGAPLPAALLEPGPVPAPAPEVSAVAPPVAVGCTLVGHRVFTPFRAGLTLSLPAAGPAFATTAPSPAGVKITATFPEGDVLGPGVRVELDDGHVVVRGTTRAVALPAAPRSLFTMGDAVASDDFLAPAGDVLVVESVARGTATVAVSTGADVSLVNGVARAQRRCNELQLDPQQVDAGTVARFVAGKPSAARQPRDVLPAGKDTPLSSLPSEAPSVLLRPEDALGAEVDVLERRGRATRIFWFHDGYALFGWIPASALHKQTARAPASLAGAVSAAPPPAPGARPLVCSADVPLHVEVGGTVTAVGTVRKGTPIVVTASRAGQLVVELRDVAVTPDRGAAWVLHPEDTAKVCAVR